MVFTCNGYTEHICLCHHLNAKKNKIICPTIQMPAAFTCRHMMWQLSIMSSRNTHWQGSTSLRYLRWPNVCTMPRFSPVPSANCWSPSPSPRPPSRIAKRLPTILWGAQGHLQLHYFSTSDSLSVLPQDHLSNLNILYGN